MTAFEWAALLTSISAQWAAVALAWINHNTVKPLVMAQVASATGQDQGQGTHRATTG